MAKENNDFNVNLGDTIYSDTEVGSTVANGNFQPSRTGRTTVAQKWAKYKQNLALANLQASARLPGSTRSGTTTSSSTTSPRPRTATRSTRRA